MNTSKYWLFILMIGLVVATLITILIKCERQDKNQIVSFDEYDGYINYDTIDWYTYYECQNKMEMNVTFDIKCNVNLDINDEDFVFMIIRDGVVYKGPFKNKIEIKMCFCMDNGFTRANRLAFVLLEHKTKLTYKWYTKETYSLFKWKHYKVVLKQDGSYDISFSNISSLRNFFY